MDESLILSQRPFVFSTSLNLNVDFVSEDRFVTIPSENPNFGCILGTTYANERFPIEPINTLCLDTFCNSSLTGAIADGYEHYPDDERNIIVWNVANTTVKNLVTLSGLFSGAKNLFENLPWIFEQVGEEIRKQFHQFEFKEEAGGLFTSAFSKNESEYEIVTGSVGDCLALAWRCETATLEVLVNPRQYKVHGVFDPMAISEPLSGGMIQKSLHVLPKGTFIIRMTDGAWQSFPYCSVRLHDSEAGYDYIEYKLDEGFLREKLLSFSANNKDGNTVQYAIFLKNLAFAEVVKKQENLKQIKIQLLEKWLIGEWKEANHSLNHFYAYVREQDGKFFSKLTEFLRDFELQIEDLDSISIPQFIERLSEGVFAGDDILINVSKI